MNSVDFAMKEKRNQFLSVVLFLKGIIIKIIISNNKVGIQLNKLFCMLVNNPGKLNPKTGH